MLGGTVAIAPSIVAAVHGSRDMIGPATEGCISDYRTFQGERRTAGPAPAVKLGMNTDFRVARIGRPGRGGR